MPGGAARNRALPLLALTAVLAFATGCQPSDPSAASSQSSGGTSGGGGGGASDGRDVSPLENPDGTKPGLAPIVSDSEKGAARALINKVPTKARGPQTGYSRDQFGDAWTDSAAGVPLAGNHCDTRDDVLARDGQGLKYQAKSTCVVTSMSLFDPYTAKTMQWSKQKATTVQIDHMVPLSYSWQMGSSAWTKDQRIQLANDTLNLLAVDGPANESKGDSGPSEWLPPNAGIRCAYVTRFAQVTLKYKLAVTDSDKAAMLKQCGG